MAESVLFETIDELARRLRETDLTSVELTRAYIERLREVGPELNAVVTVTEERAMEMARRADEELRNGTDRGPLHGIPYGVKDLLTVAGYKTTWGANPYRDQEFNYDATVVTRLDDAGAVLIAKLAMVELAGGMGYEPDAMTFTGPGRNPWNTSAWSGGSSSGPGSAVPAGLVGFAIGSETWGSIFSPSANSGIAGLRPTYGAVSRHGAMALSYTMDKLGPMCRSAEGCGFVLRAIAGPDSDDPTTIRDLDLLRNYSLSEPLELATLEGAGEEEQEAVRENFHRSLDTLREFATVDEITLPDLPYDSTASIILFAEAGSAFDDLIESGRVQKLTSPEGSIGGYAYDTILGKDYVTANRVREKIQRQLDETLEPYDALVLPTRLSVADPIDPPESYTAPEVGGPSAIGGATNVAGLPGITVPNGFGPRGLPTAVSFTGRAFDDLKLVEIAREYQCRTDHVDYTDLLEEGVGAETATATETATEAD